MFQRPSPLANVMLRGRMYDRLGDTFQNVDGFFQRWEEALQKRDFQSLMSLVHWGLQLLLSNAKDSDKVRLVIHYLKVADGHARPENFVQLPERRIGEPQKRVFQKELSDKAWVELCNRFFIFLEEDSRRPTYLDILIWPDLVNALIDFADPERWIGEINTYEWERSNINPHDQKQEAYNQKALRFIRAFLKFAWSFGDKYQDDRFKDWEKWLDPKTLAGARYSFRSIRPKLVLYMDYFKILDYLRERKLDTQTRATLKKLTFGWCGIHPDVIVPDISIEEAYGERDLEHGWLKLSRRKPAEILILYPLLQKGRRKLIHHRNRKAREERENRIAELRNQLETTQSSVVTELRTLGVKDI